MSVTPWLPTNGIITGANGVVYINVLNPLSTPSGETTTINVITWAYGSSDLEFACPRINSANLPNPVLEEQCVDMALGDARFGNLDGSFSVPGTMVMGERLTSIKDWIQKMAFGAAAGSLANSTFFTFYHNDAPNLNTPVVTSHMMHFSRMFVISRGSVRYAPFLYSASTRIAPVEQYMVGFNTNASFDLRYGLLVVRSATPNSMIQVPFYAINTFLPTKASTSFTNVPTATASGATAVSSSWFYGAGDDFMFAYLVPPLVTP